MKYRNNPVVIEAIRHAISSALVIGFLLGVTAGIGLQVLMTVISEFLQGSV